MRMIIGIKMADWDDEDFEPGDFSVKQSDKWDGEDEEDKDVKENWDDEEEDSGKTVSTENKTEKPPEATVKKRKTLKQVLQEKEEKRKETLLKREENQQDSKEQESEPLTKEEELAEKLRQKKLVEESDLELAKQAFGVKDDIGSKSIDEMNPSTKEEFVELSSLLVEKLSHYESCGEYVSFLEMLFRDLCASLEADDVKRLGSTINILSSEKLKAQKAKKGKKTVKKATLSGASAKSGRKDDLDAFGTGTYDYRDDFDDFM